MTKNNSTVKGYKINFTNNTITMNYKFYKNAQDITSKEYQLLKAIKEDFPAITLVVEAGRKVTTTQKNKRLTYENMLRHMNSYKNADELVEMFEIVKELSMPLASPYKYVCDWFNTQFPNYKNCMLSLEATGNMLPVASAPNLANYAKKETIYSA